MSPEDYYTYAFRPEHSFYTTEEIPISPAPAPVPAPVPAPRAQPQPGGDGYSYYPSPLEPTLPGVPGTGGNVTLPVMPPPLDGSIRILPIEEIGGDVKLPIDLVDPNVGGGDIAPQVIVYGPDGTAYPNPLAALRAGVTNYTTTPPPGSGFANGGRVFAPAPAGALVRAARAVPAPGRNPLALAALGRRGGYR